MSKTCTYNIKVNYVNRDEKDRKYTVNKKLTNVILTESGCRIHTKQIKQGQGLTLPLRRCNDEFHSKSCVIYATE